MPKINSLPLNEIKKNPRFVEKIDGINISRVIFPHDMQIGLADSSFQGNLVVKGEIKGHIYTLSDGKSYLVAGENIDIVSGSDDSKSVIISVKEDIIASTLSGSLTRLNDGKSYLVAGSNITITSASNGQVTISSSGGGGGGSGAVSSVANGADNRIATFSSADALNGEANLTFDGSDMTLSGDASLDGSIVINESGASKDFRVESANNQNMLIVKGSTDRVGIGRVSAPQANLHLKEVTPTFRIQRSNNANDATLEFAGSAGSVGASMVHLASSNDLVFSTHDGSVPQEILRLGGHQVSDVRQVILLSGSGVAGTSMQPQSTDDINFFVSGSIGSAKTSTRGTSAFGGDLMLSGSLHVTENILPSSTPSDGQVIAWDNTNKRLYWKTAMIGFAFATGISNFVEGEVSMTTFTVANAFDPRTNGTYQIATTIETP